MESNVQFGQQGPNTPGQPYYQGQTSPAGYGYPNSPQMEGQVGAVGMPPPGYAAVPPAPGMHPPLPGMPLPPDYGHATNPQVGAQGYGYTPPGYPPPGSQMLAPGYGMPSPVASNTSSGAAPPGSNEGSDDNDDADDDLHHPSTPYMNPNWVMQPGVFSEEFQKQYQTDLSCPEGGHDVSFLPPTVIPPNQVTEANDCVCLPDKSDRGCSYFVRIFCSAISHLIVIASIILIVHSVMNGREIIATLYIVVGVSFFFVVAEPFFAYDVRYLKEMKSAEQFAEYMLMVHTARPTLSMHVECYHYKTRWVTTTSRHKGKTRRHRKRQRTKVVTHRASENFVFTSCQELSPPNINVDGVRATRIVFSRTYKFADDRTRTAFQTQSTNFRNQARSRDRHMRYWERFDIPGFQSMLLAVQNTGASHPCFRPSIFYFVSLIFCTWPYRWWFRRVTAKTTYTFVKELKL